MAFIYCKDGSDLIFDWLKTSPPSRYTSLSTISGNTSTNRADSDTYFTFPTDIGNYPLLNWWSNIPKYQNSMFPGYFDKTSQSTDQPQIPNTPADLIPPYANSNNGINSAGFRSDLPVYLGNLNGGVILFGQYDPLSLETNQNSSIVIQFVKGAKYVSTGETVNNQGIINGFIVYDGAANNVNDTYVSSSFGENGNIAIQHINDSLEVDVNIQITPITVA